MQLVRRDLQMLLFIQWYNYEDCINLLKQCPFGIKVWQYSLMKETSYV